MAGLMVANHSFSRVTQFYLDTLPLPRPNASLQLIYNICVVQAGGDLPACRQAGATVHTRKRLAYILKPFTDAIFAIWKY